MGTEAIWVPLVMSAVGAGATAYAGNQAAKRQDRELANRLRAQGQKQREADAKVGQLLDQRQGSNADAERGSILDKFREAMTATGDNSTAGLQQVGALSQAAKDGTADAALGIGGYGDQVADLLSRIDAPQAQRQRESNENTRFGQDIAGIMRRSQGDDFLSELRLQGIRPNPWLQAAGSVLQGAAGGMAGGGGGGAAGGAQPIPISPVQRTMYPVRPGGG